MSFGSPSTTSVSLSISNINVGRIWERYREQRPWLHSKNIIEGVFRYPAVSLLAAFLIGHLLCSWLEPWIANPWLYWCTASIAAIALIALWKAQRYRFAVGYTVFILSVIAVGAYHAASQPDVTADSLSPFATRIAQPVALRATIASAAEWSPNPFHRPTDPSSEAFATCWVIEYDAVRDGSIWTVADGKCHLRTTGRVDDLFPGDRITIFGTYRAISPPTNPGEFNFAEFARLEYQFISVSAKSREQIILDRSGLLFTDLRWTGPRLRAFAIKQVDRWLTRWIGPNMSPFAAALIFGSREQISEQQQEDMIKTGTVHLLAISGMHVELLAASVAFLCGLLMTRSRTLAIALILVCGSYAALSGGNAPVLRAFLMIFAFSAARALGRNGRLPNILALAAFLLILLKPAYAHQSGVHLSFLAVVAIAIFVIPINGESSRRTAVRKLLEEALPKSNQLVLSVQKAAWMTWRTSGWIWLFTCPVVWNTFHIVSPISVVANLVVIYPFIVGLIATLLTALIGWFPPLAFITGSLASVALAFVDRGAAFCSSIPFGYFWLPAPPAIWIIIYYVVILLWLIHFGKRKRLQLSAILVALIACATLPSLIGPRGILIPSEPVVFQSEATAGSIANDALPLVDPGELRCTFLDVGHGTSVLLHFPDNQIWLYDCGHLGSPASGISTIASVLWSIPTSRIDRLIISHADSDHYNAVPGIAERFRIGHCITTSVVPDAILEQSSYLAATDGGIKLQDLCGTISSVESGDKYSNGRYSVSVLHPPKNQVYKVDNASSLVLLVEYAGKRILLPGDIEGKGMQDLVSQPQVHCDVLLAPHHGSLSHDPKEIIEWATPECIVIAGGTRTADPKVRETIRGSETRYQAITFLDGAIQVRIRHDGSTSYWRWGESQTWTALAPVRASSASGEEATNRSQTKIEGP